MIRKYKPKLCVICSVKYIPTNGRQRYCVVCRPKVEKAQDHKYKRKHNEKYKNDPTWRMMKRKWNMITNANRLKKHIHKVKCRWRLQRAIHGGKIIRGKCEVCGNKKTEGHHDDYNKPFQVRWLCSKCHWKLHGKLCDEIILFDSHHE